MRRCTAGIVAVGLGDAQEGLMCGWDGHRWMWNGGYGGGWGWGWIVTAVVLSVLFALVITAIVLAVRYLTGAGRHRKRGRVVPQLWRGPFHGDD